MLGNVHAQQILTLLQINNFQKATTYAALTVFAQQFDENSALVHVEIIGQSVQKRNL